jgi:uncharacterized protein YneR
VSLIVLDNWRNKFVKTFNLDAKNPIKFMIEYGGIPSVIRLLYLKNLVKL